MSKLTKKCIIIRYDKVRKEAERGEAKMNKK